MFSTVSTILPRRAILECLHDSLGKNYFLRFMFTNFKNFDKKIEENKILHLIKLKISITKIY